MPQASEGSRETGSRGSKAALFDEFARLAQALANGRRLEIIDVLANGERTVERLASETGLSVANASQHLQVLRGVGLVRCRRDGTRIYYELRDPEVFDLWRTFLKRPQPSPTNSGRCQPGEGYATQGTIDR